MNYAQMNEVQVKKTQMELANMLTMIKALKDERVLNLLKKWQGKRCTKRLGTALKQIDEHFNLSNTYGTAYYLEYNFYDYNERSFEVKRGYDSSYTVYIDNYKHCLYRVADEYEDFIIRDSLVDNIKSITESMELQYKRVTKQLQDIETYIDKFNKIVKMYNEFENEVDTGLRVKFGMSLTSR